MTKHLDPRSLPAELESIRKHMLRFGPDRQAIPQNDLCVIYARFSTRHQRSTSTIRQRDVCIGYSEHMEFLLREQYLFADEGHTGDSLDGRRALEEMRKLIRSGAVGKVLLYSWCRWSRRPGDAMTLFDECICHGVEVHVCSGSITGRINHFQAIILSIFAMEEREKTLSQTSWASFAAAAAGKNMGGIPYGMRRGKQAGDIEIDPTPVMGNLTKAAIVREIFIYFAVKRLSLRDIALILNKRGIPSPRGKIWRPSSILPILRNVKHVGYLLYGKTKTQRTMGKADKKRTAGELSKLKDFFNPDIAHIDAALFIEANEILDAGIKEDKARPADAPRGERASKSRVLLPDAYRCVCGSSMRLAGTSSNNGNRQMSCMAAYDQGPTACDRKTSVTAQHVEMEILREIRDNIISVKAVELFNSTYIAKARSERDAIIAERVRISSEIAEINRWLDNSYLESLKAGRSEARINQVCGGLEAKIKKLEEDLAKLTVPEERHAVPQVQVGEIRKAINRLIRLLPLRDPSDADLTVVSALRRLIGTVVIDRPDGKKGYTLLIEASLEKLAPPSAESADNESKKPTFAVPIERFPRVCPAPVTHPPVTLEMLEYAEEMLETNAFGSSDEDWAAIEPLWAHWNHDRKRHVLDAALYYLRLGAFGLQSLPPPFDGGHSIQYRVEEMIATGCWAAAFEAMERIQSPTVEGLDELCRAARFKRLALPRRARSELEPTCG